MNASSIRVGFKISGVNPRLSVRGRGVASGLLWGCLLLLSAATIRTQGEVPCKATAALERSLAQHPTATAYEVIGAYFAQHKLPVCAENALRKAVALDPRVDHGYVDLALVMAGQGHVEEAESELRDAIAADEGNTQALTARGMVLTRMHRPDEGITEFRKVVALFPASADAHLNLGIALADRHDLEGALVEFTEAVRIASQLAAPHYNRGRVLSDLRRGDEARLELEAAIRLDPHIGDAFYLLAMIETQSQENESAEGHFRKAVALMPQNDQALYMLGKTLQHKGDMPGAVLCWRRVIALNPDYADAYYNLSRALAQSSPNEARKYQARFDELQARQRMQDRAQTLGNFALASADAKDWPRAIAQMQEAIQACGECSALPTLHKNLGLIYCRSENWKSGLVELLEAQRLAPTDANIDKAIRIARDALK